MIKINLLLNRAKVLFILLVNQIEAINFSKKVDFFELQSFNVCSRAIIRINNLKKRAHFSMRPTFSADY
jgi:hypothetical protein